MKGIKNKKAMSEVITTVLIILITVSSVTILAAVIIPFVRDSLNDSTQCPSMRDYLTIESTKYTCSNSTFSSVMIKRGFNQEKEAGASNQEKPISAIRLILMKPDGNSVSYDILNRTTLADVNMYDNGILIQDLELPNEGEIKTYTTNFYSTKARLGLILQEGGKVCEQTDYIPLPSC